MVRVGAPPPQGRLRPLHARLAAGSPLLRLYNPSRYNAEPLTFRAIGPLMRFDHHRVTPPAAPHDPAKQLYHDPDRAISYGARQLSCCLVEVFGDSRIISLEPWMLAVLRPQRPLELLNLLGAGAMGAGTCAAIAKVPMRSLSQSWSRWFYEHPVDYQSVDGLLFASAHNDQRCIVLFERAQAALAYAAHESWPLTHSALRPIVYRTARGHNMTVL